MTGIETEKESNDFLNGVPAIVQAIKDGKIEFRVYAKQKFHAKAYITHGRLEVVGSTALVGSSNFTHPGLTQNVELNVQITGQPVGVYTNLVVRNHTDLQRTGLRAEFEQLAARSDAIVIDEAHNFRNPGIAGEGEREKSATAFSRILLAEKRHTCLRRRP